jgi:hypothetical protein
MRSDVERANSESDKNFREIVWPAIIREWTEWLEGYRLTNEMRRSDRSALEDCEADMDIVARHQDGGLISISQRTQKVELAAWRSLTIRSWRRNGTKTQLAKMMRAYKQGLMRPTFQIQGYVNPATRILFNAFGVRFDEFWGYVDRFSDELEERFNPQDGNRFLVAWVGKIQARGIEVKKFSGKTFLDDCVRRHQEAGRLRPHRTWTEKRADTDRVTIAAKGDVLRAQGLALPLCWLPGDPHQ